jgi:hypothetical protein
MNKQNFNQSGGFPIKTQTLDEMQKSWTLLNALGDLAGNFSIIQGCVTTGANVSDGVVFINGEVLEFRGSMVGASVIIVEEVTPREFKDASTKNVLYVRYAAFGSGVVSFAWADFKRNSTLAALTAAVETITNFLSTVNVAAEPNVQADWNQNVDTADDFIKNKPTIANILAKGTANLGDIGTTDQLKTVNFPTISTSSYIIVGSLISKQVDGNEGGNFLQGWNRDNDVTFVIANKTASSFQIGFRELNNGAQNLDFDYIILER